MDIYKKIITKHEIIGKTKKNKDKPKNGDFFKYKILDNKLIVLTLADGVGSKVCDWLASQTACEKFTEYCELMLHKNFSENDLLKICYHVNETIIKTSGNCKGMLSVFSAVIWDTDNDFFHFINIGDTRIYKISNNSISQISEDQMQSVIMKNKQGKLIISDGTTVVRTGITNALGTKDFNVDINKCDFSYGDTIILASDGFYNCKSSFDADILKSCQSSDLEKSTDNMFVHYSDYQTDDATFLLLRRNDIDIRIKKDYKSIHDFDKIKEKIPNHTLTQLLHSELTENINKKNKETCILILNKMQKNNLLLTQEEYDELLKKCNLINFKDAEIFQKIIGQIRIIHKNI